MQVGAAKSAARRWVAESASRLPGFEGAFCHGSTAWMLDNAVLPESSDLDVMVILSGPELPARPGKFQFEGVLLEASYLPREEIRSPEAVLGVSHLAGSLRAPGILADRTGHLTALQAVVARDFALRRWVRARCEHAREKVVRNLHALDETVPLHDQAAAWLFAAGVTTHVLLCAGLRNPTVRRRYVAVRDLLAEYGRYDFYAPLLDLLDAGRMNRERVEAHVAALAEVFDAASVVIRTPFPFAADISNEARPVAIDGSRQLIERGFHREALFWIVATQCRCQKVLQHDAPELQERFDPAFRELLRDLGITSPADLRRRGEQVEAFLPRLWTVAEAIMSDNPDIEDEPAPAP